MNTIIAIGCAALAACCYAAAVAREHSAVRAAGSGRLLSARELVSVLRSRRWQVGALLGVAGGGLHITALSLAPLVIVQPIGVLSLVMTVLVGFRTRGIAVAPVVRAAVVSVCAGLAGFVVVATADGASSVGSIRPGPAQAVAAGALVLAATGLSARGRARCLLLAASAAVLFGTGSALIRAASQLIIQAGSVPGGLGLAAEAVLLMVAGGWLLHQAYASGPAAVVIAATTVIDPLSAVAVGIAFYGEAARTSLPQAATQAGFALLAVAGVIVLARSIPDPRPIDEEHDMPTPGPSHGAGLRIVIGADTFPPDINGAANFADRLARGLARRGHDVHVICPQPRATATTDNDGVITVHRIPSLPTPFHPTFRFCTPWQASRAVQPLLERLRPDVVHVQAHFGVGRAVLSAAGQRGVPVIATNHFMPENLLGYAPIPHFVRAPLKRWAWRDLVRVYRDAQIVTAPTARAVQLLTANGLPGHPRAISCGIDLDHYAVQGPTAAAGRASVLFVGRLDQEKNVDQLIGAVAAVPGVRAEIVGDGACRERLTALAESLGVRERVRFRGFVSDRELVLAYQRAAVFCMPGTAELQSLATMEAMAAGLPVIAADAMALPHLVKPGVNGFLYQPGDIAQLAAGIAQLIGDAAGRAAMGRASRTMIAAHAIENTLDAFEDIYLHAIETIHPVAPTNSTHAA
jgi:glycosyltransferase involved in cell wall biosynthesis